MVWVGGTLDMKSSKEVSSVVEDDWSEGSVRCWRFWRTSKGDVGCDRVFAADEDRCAGLAAAEWRLAGLRRLRCLEEDDSDARGANEFGLLKFVSGI